MSALESVIKVVSSLAPELGVLLGGPAGGVVGTVISHFFGADPNNPDDLIAKINADPNAAQKLSEIRVQLAQINAQKESRELQSVETLAQIEESTQKNAQDREVKLAEAGNPDDTPKILAIRYTLGYFAVIFLYIAFPSIRDSLKDLGVMQALSAGEMLILSYYYGSSIGSKSKEKAMISTFNRHKTE